MAPATALEIMRDGSQRISAAFPDIAPAIAVKIHGQTFKIARHELRLAHGASPGTAHAIGADVAIIQNTQSGDQFIAKIGCTAPFPGKRRQCFNHAKAAGIAAVIRLHTPNRHNHRRGYMVTRFNTAEQISVFRHQAPPILDARWRQHDPVAIIFPGQPGFRLAPVQFNDTLIGLDAGKRLIERCVRNPGAACLRAHPFQKAFKGLAGDRHKGRRAIGARDLVGGIRLCGAARDQGRDSAKQEPSIDHGVIRCHGAGSMANPFGGHIGRG